MVPKKQKPRVSIDI